MRPAGVRTVAEHDEAADRAAADASAAAGAGVDAEADDAASAKNASAAVSQPMTRGMLSDDMQYAVYLHAGALESLGETLAPFLSQGPHGPHIICSEIDTGGALCEMTVETTTADGARQHTELMFPVGMIRLVMSVGGLANGFGFRTRE